MNPVVEQTSSILKSMPLSRKIAMVAVLGLVVTGFALMFFWANTIDYQPLYTNLSPEDASEIIAKLKEQRVAYQLGGGGTMILVPAEKVYDVRLSMAGAGLPSGGAVGHELFDETDFGTTEFVQKLNYKRALQGELARTIKQFREIVDAKVLVVMPKNSIFIQETKPPSASVLLKLRSSMGQEKVDAIVHLVASAIEDLSPERVTVVDTNGKVLSRGNPEEKVGSLASSQFDYKSAYEKNLAARIQTMLEQIVGEGKAIVRVSADMSFDQVNINEELYDPDSQVIRSKQSIVESADQRAGSSGSVSSVNPVGAAASTTAPQNRSDRSQRQDETVNYEINRTIRQVVKPVGTVQRLSVATVLDGSYVFETDANGNQVRKYVARTKEELAHFKTIVQNAMGYSSDREDQVSVESFPFAYMDEMTMEKSPAFDWVPLVKQYGRTILNVFLILLVFLFVVRPMIKTVKEVKSTVVQSLPAGAGRPDELPEPPAAAGLPELADQDPRQKAENLAKQNVDKTSNLIRGWIGEAS